VRVEKAAMQAVMDKEFGLGNKPVDVSAAKLGWDIESRISENWQAALYRSEREEWRVLQRVTVSKNEILAGLNKPEDFILAVVEVIFMNGNAHGRQVKYLYKAFKREPDFAATSVNYDLRELFKDQG
jgi:hypothetical protein